MIGVMSMGPSDGITCLSGFRIGSLNAYDQRIHGEYGDIGSHELTTLTSNAIRSTSKSHDTISRNIPLGPLWIANPAANTSARMKSSTLTRRIPPITTAASAQRGALAGFPPARTTRRSIGSINGSIFVRE